MSQYITEDIFRDHLAKRGVQVELGTEPTSLEQDSDGVNVTVKKVDISNGTETAEVIRAAYVIGADGARGRVSSIPRTIFSHADNSCSSMFHQASDRRHI